MIKSRTFIVLLTGVIAGLCTSRSVEAQSDVLSTRLQSLVNDTAVQLQLSCRHDANERQRRIEQLSHAIAAWNASGRSAEDNQRLAEWLRSAMRASMPGARQPLPRLPEFDRPPVPQVTPPATEPTTRYRPVLSPMAGQNSPERDTASGSTDLIDTSSRQERAEMSAPTIPADIFSADDNSAEDGSSPSTEVTDEEAEDLDDLNDFWSHHPASDDLPDDIWTGDPFKDDPLPSAEAE